MKRWPAVQVLIFDGQIQGPLVSAFNGLYPFTNGLSPDSPLNGRLFSVTSPGKTLRESSHCSASRVPFYCRGLAFLLYLKLRKAHEQLEEVATKWQCQNSMFESQGTGISAVISINVVWVPLKLNTIADTCLWPSFHFWSILFITQGK